MWEFTGFAAWLCVACCCTAILRMAKLLFFKVIYLMAIVFWKRHVVSKLIWLYEMTCSVKHSFGECIIPETVKPHTLSQHVISSTNCPELLSSLSTHQASTIGSDTQNSGYCPALEMLFLIFPLLVAIVCPVSNYCTVFHCLWLLWLS